MSRLYIAYRPVTPAPIIPPVVYEPETEAYLNALGVSNDSTTYMGSTVYEITGANLWTYLNNFVVNVKNIFGLTLGSNNLSTQFKFIYPRFLDTSSAHRYNLVTGLQDATYFGGWTHDGGGATPNGTNGYVDLNINYTTANFTNNNQSFGFFSKTNTSAGIYADFGMINDGRSNAVMYTNGTDIVTRLNSETNKTLTLSSSLGVLSMSRTSSTQYKTFRNGLSIGTNTDNSTAMYIPPQGFKLVEGALYNAGSLSVAFFSPRKRTWFWGGLGMTDSQMLDFYNELANIETLLNR